MQIARTFVATFAFSTCIHTTSFRGNILSGEKGRNILLNLEFTLCNCSGITAQSWLFRVYRILSHMYLYDRDIFRLFDTSGKLMEEIFVSITAR